jgi:PAS domain-containing protein
MTLLSIGDAVVTTDIEGRVTSMNAVAETLTGWPSATRSGRSLDDVFRIVNEDSRQPVAESRRDGAAAGRRRRPRQPHRADSAGRQRVPDRRQRRADPGRAGVVSAAS